MQMSDVDPSGADSWRNTGLRNSVLSKIEEALRVSGNITTKSPSDMERHIYSKARSKEEYLSFVARLIIHFKDTSKNKMQAGGGAGGGGASGGGVPQQQQQQQTQQQQMINQQQQQSQQQISLMQQQQQQNLQQSQQQQNMQQHQLSALQQQQLQQQMKSNQQQSGPMTIGQQAMTMQQLQQQQQSQQQILSNSNVSLGGMMGNGNNNNNPNVMQNNNAPNGQKMNPMLMNSSLISNVGHGGPNSGNNNMGPTSLDQDNSNNINNSGGVGIVPNMLNMKNAKQQQQLNSGLGMNSNMSGIVNSNLPLNINSQLNQSNVNNTNAGPNSGNMMNSGMSNVGPNNQIVTNLLNSNMKQKLVSNLMPQNSAQGGAGGGIVHSNLINSNLQGGGGPTHVTINQLQAAQQQQQQSGPNSQQQTLSLQQQLAQHHQQQQQQQQQHSQNRMLQPNSTMMMSNANAGRMMLNQGIRQQAGQQSGQINLAPNLQAQLRLRGQSIISGGPNNMQQTMAGLQQQQQQPGQSGPIPIYLQQQQQSQQSMLQPQQQQQQQAMLQQQQSQNQDKFFELSQQQSGQQRITPVTISSQGQPPFKTGLLNTSNNPNTINSQSGPFVQTFNANMIPQQSQQPGLPPGQLNVNSSGIGTVVGPGQSIASNSLLQSNQIGGPLSNQGPGQAMLSSGGPQIQQIKQQPQMGPQQMQQQQMQGPNKMLVAPNSAMMQSPSNFHVPSPINPMMSSPAARHSVATLSPQSALNTPASPGAVPPPQQSASQQRSLTSSQEEALYNEKLQSMQKFTGRLLRSIQKLEQEDRKTNDIDKMRNLYNILTEVTRCPLPVLERCEKFLERLEKDQYFKNAKQHTGQPSGPGSGMQQTSDYSPAGSIPSVPSIPPPVQTVANQQLNAGPGGTASQLIATGGAIAATGAVPGSAIASNKLNDICQPLLDSVLKYCDKPMFSHTLHRTFGPALAVLHPEPYQSTNRVNMTGSFVHYSNATCSPILDTYETDEKSGVAVKRRKTEHSFVNTTPTTTTTTGTLAHVNLISNILQGEISRLNGRFKIQPLTNNKRLGADTGPKINCKTQNLICRLDDPHLPCIPPLICYIPESYPEISPTFRFEAEQYESSDFFRKIHLNFRSNQAKLRSNFTFTALLHTWERSVRQVIYLVSQAAAAGADQPSPPPLPTQTSTTGTNGNSGSTTTATTTTTNGSTVNNNNNNVNESSNKSNLSNIKNKSHITNGIAINPLKQIQLVN